jgi:CDP-2,3-bis-(O-geranylgeranyl)-sn-glycerol synthase
MINPFLYKLWLFLPAIVANMAPVSKSFKIFRRIPNAPLDFGAKLSDGYRVLGDGKTFLGTILGIAAGSLVGLLQGNLLLGFLLSTGTLAGDAVGSFFKRRAGKARGANVFVLDQLDFVVGAVAFSWPLGIFNWSIWEFAALCLLILPAHTLVCRIGYALKIKKEPW